MNYDPSLLGRKYRLQQEIEERQREINFIDAQLLQNEQPSSSYLTEFRRQQKEQKVKEAAEEFQRQQEKFRWQQQMGEKINPFQTPPSTDSTWRI